MFPAMSLTVIVFGMREVAVDSVEDDVLERDIHGFGPELHRERLIRLVAQAIEKGGIDGRRLLSDQPRERGALRAVSLARRAEAAEQVNLERRCLGELVRRQLRAALVEIVGDAHRADRVRARGARSHLVELVQRRHHGPLLLLHDIQGREKAAASAAFLWTCPLSVEPTRGGPE